MKKLVLLTALLGMMVVPAAADIVAGDLILIETLSLSTPDGTQDNTRADGNVWNAVDFADGGSGTLQLADDTDESVTINRTGTLPGGFKNSAGTLLSGLSWVASDVSVKNFHYQGTAGTPITFEIVGLNASLQYDIRMATAANLTSYNDQTVAVNGVANASSTDYDSYANSTGGSTLLDMSWDNVSLSSGKLTFSITDADYRATTGVISIEAVPEPATMGLLAIGGIAMLIRRKRK